MHAIVVYESHWGSTAAIARAIAEGIGPEAEALTTDEATPELVASADLLVAGAPLMGFQLPSDGMVATIADDPRAPEPADVSHPTMRAWLDALPALPVDASAHRAASFETKIRWSPGGATGGIETRLRRAGFRTIARGEKFVVKGKYGPVRDGEIERAKEWGAALKAKLAK